MTRGGIGLKRSEENSLAVRRKGSEGKLPDRMEKEKGKLCME